MMAALYDFFKKNRFRREITLVILLKIAAIFLLWELFFSQPVSPQLTKTELTQHLMG